MTGQRLGKESFLLLDVSGGPGLGATGRHPPSLRLEDKDHVERDQDVSELQSSGLCMGPTMLGF